MTDRLRCQWLDVWILAVVVGLAAGTRAWYLGACADFGRASSPLQVQGQPTALPAGVGAALPGRPSPNELDYLVHNLVEHQWFGCPAPLADEEEVTAHVAPGYPWLFAQVARWSNQADQTMRWSQCVLGALTSLGYYFFVRRAFQSRLLAAIVGLLCAWHPFWIVNVAELNDGVLTTFLLSVSLALGSRVSQAGGACACFLFGLVLACLALVRAALLPFAIVALLWFLLCSRQLRVGWFYGLLAFLGFANGLAPWTVRNYRVFAEPLPVVDSAYWHLWTGNNPKATGGPVDEPTIRSALPPERLKEILAEPNQSRRYKLLARNVVDEVLADPAQAFGRRFHAAVFFLCGDNWFHRGAEVWQTGKDPAEQRSLLANQVIKALPTLFPGILWGMLVLAFLGWRWSLNWRKPTTLATLAVLLIPLPYVLGHAEALVGPRLPLDGVLWCFAVFAVACLIPPLRETLLKGPEEEEPPRWYGPGSI